MTRDEWNQVLATEAATPDQVGAIQDEFWRLGYRDADRAGRLAVTAALLGLDRIDSTRDLVMGDAGRLVRMLRDVGDRGELAAMLAEPEVTPQYAPVPAVTWADVFAALAAFIKAIDPGRPRAAAATSPAPE